MVGAEFIDYISKFQLTTYAGVEDFSDKFNFLATVVVLSLCTIIVTVKQYIMKPISCYIATEIGGSNLLNYVENYCWVQGTLPLSYRGSIPASPQAWKELDNHKILYYQWVPFVLGLQCILFYIPRMIWQMICFNRTGTNLENLISKAIDAVRASGKSRNDIIEDLAYMVELIIFQQQKKQTLRRSFPSYFSRKHTINYEGTSMLDTSNEPIAQQKSKAFIFSKNHKGTYIVTTYLFVKLLYFINAIGQIFLMQTFLGESTAFGYEVLVNMIKGHDWEMTLIFPRVGFCFSRIEALGSRSNGVTAQCALPVNMLNEKIYVFLWWWISFAVLLTFISLIVWLYRICNSSGEANYIIKYINLAEDQTEHDVRDEDAFTREFLRRDGMFLMRMLRMNAGDVVAASVINCLWKNFLYRIYQEKIDPLTNYKNRPFSNSVGLEKGGNTHGDNNLRKRFDDFNPGKESLYPTTEPFRISPSSDDKITGSRTVV